MFLLAAYPFLPVAYAQDDITARSFFQESEASFPKDDIMKLCHVRIQYWFAGKMQEGFYDVYWYFHPSDLVLKP